MDGQPLILPHAFVATRRAASGAEYRIFVAPPPQPAPPRGYPVIYLLDPDGAFATLTEAIRMRARRPDATGVGPALVVGIGHGEPGEAARRRRLVDYTPGPPRDPGEEPAAAGHAGGAGRFLDFLERELRPAIARDFPIDPAHQTLFGHSLAGLFTLWAFAQSASFTAYVAASPSLWWDPPALDAALAARRPGPARTRVLITVGEYEQARAPWQPDGAITAGALQRRAARRMVDRAADTARRIAALDGVDVAHHCFAGEDHASVVVLTIARALRVVLPPACDLPGGDPTA